MTGFEVYKTYLALKQHFTKQEYDYFKYNGKVRANENSFEQGMIGFITENGAIQSESISIE